MAASVRPQTNFILIELEEGISEKQNAIFPYFTNYFVISFDNQMACWKTRISGNQRNKIWHIHPALTSPPQKFFLRIFPGIWTVSQLHSGPVIERKIPGMAYDIPTLPRLTHKLNLHLMNFEYFTYIHKYGTVPRGRVYRMASRSEKENYNKYLHTPTLRGQVK